MNLKQVLKSASTLDSVLLVIHAVYLVSQRVQDYLPFRLYRCHR